MIRKLLFLIISSLCVTFSSSAEEIATPIRVYVDVCGDLTHAGHAEFFKNAREFGDYLIVGVHSDEAIASYKRIPILTMQERMAMIQACRYVDEVVPEAPLKITDEWIQQHKIDIVVHGDDIKEENLHYMYGVPIRLGIFRTVPYTEGISTTEIIKRIIDRYCNAAQPQE